MNDLYINLNATFEKRPDLSFPNGNEDTDNLLIEGDNLTAMFHLGEALGWSKAETYNPPVDLMLWDPPYNTGSNGFYYQDSRSEVIKGSDGKWETHWTVFIRKRLRVAKSLMKETGAIAVHIDEREFENLSRIMAQEFGRNNKISIVHWESTCKRGSGVANVVEYIIIYAKNIRAFELQKVTSKCGHPEKYKNPDKDPKGDWTRWVAYRAEANGTKSATREYGVENYLSPGTFIYPPAHSIGWIQVAETMIASFAEGGLRYRYEAKDNTLRFVSDDRPATERYYLPKLFIEDGKLFSKLHLSARENRPNAFANLIAGKETRAKVGKQLFDAIMGPNNNFTTVKPLEVEELLIKHLCPVNGCVMDVFAGSGTTGHAVLSLNKDLGHNRSFILIDRGSPAHNFFVNTTTGERLRRAITGDWHRSKKAKALGGSFHYLQLVSEEPDLSTVPCDPHYYYVMECTEDENKRMKLIKLGITKDVAQRRKEHANRFLKGVKVLKSWCFNSKKEAQSLETVLNQKYAEHLEFNEGSDETFRFFPRQVDELVALETIEDLLNHAQNL